MKVSKIEIGATIPVMQYGNLQPKVEMTDVDLEEGTQHIMGHLKGMFAKYADRELKENEVKALIKTECIQKESFNEDVKIDFDEKSHSYYYKGKKLNGVTTYIKKYFGEFDADMMSKVSAKSWGVEQQEVKDLWDSNGQVTALFGKAVHLALEHYSRFKAIGQTIADKKGLENNYCLPKHPMIKQIIEEFIAIDTLEGQVVPEVLVTWLEGEMCGQADRILVLSAVQKRCRIQDYKINVGSEEVSSNNKVLPPFQSLPANKLSKYQIQMSIYANMLQKQGWTVEGLDVFVHDGKWKHHALPVLNVI